MPYFRSDQAAIHVNVAGVGLDKESWDMMEGGDPVAEAVSLWPGGMAPEVNLGGLPKWTPIVVERTWSEVLAGVYKALVGVTGFAIMECSYVQYAAGTKQPQGTVFSYTGVLTATERPKYKASESVQALLKLTMGVNGQVS